MDLMDRINALTDDQLQMVAAREDASGVLAAYRLAELRGLPYPDREAAILGDGYVIVAQNGTVQKIPVDSVEKIIREESGEYCVYSEDGSRGFGCYPTMAQAQERLQQIHSFRTKAATVIDVDGTVISYGRVNRELVDTVNALPGPKIILTARVEAMREETVSQLDDAGITYSRLILKPETEQDTASWKADQVRALAQEYGQIVAIDDEADNRAAMRATGADVVSPSQVASLAVTDKAVLREGSFVSWNSSGGRARGQIEHIMYEGVLGVPGSEFSINATEDDPAVLIRIWRQGADGWAATETLVGHRMSTLSSITPLNKQATKREDGEDFPPEAFAYTPDREMPSTWKLRLWDSLAEKETRAQVGRALAALGPGGFRGNRVEIPAEDLPGVRRKILAAWRKVNEPDAEIPDLLKQSFTPPQGVQEAAQRALDWIAEGHAGSGFTDVGRARAAQLARGDAVSEDTIRRMASYLARHEGDSSAEGFSAGEDGFPSPGRVAWDAWGGDPAIAWTRSVIAGLESADKQYDPEDVLSPRQRMMYEKYEWIADTFGAWDGGVGADGAHYIPVNENVFNEKGINCGNCVFYEGGGGCEILNMPVEAGGACKLWIIPEDVVRESAKATVKQISSDGRFLRKEAYKRFTLGPLYVPDFMDAHGEWTDSNELQQAVWEWVKGGDRTIYLQHDRDVRAGEWVEVMTMPQPWTVDMLNGKGESLGKITYPAGTVFLGVIWDEGPWDQILRGELRGYSIGGFSDRVLADLPDDAAREGIELEQADEPSLAKSIAEAVADAVRKTQPTVNIVISDKTNG